MILLAFIVGFVIAVMIAAFNRPDVFKVERHLKMAATPEAIFPLLIDFKQWNTWSPWEKKDETMEKIFTGAESGVGAVYEWQGKKGVGQGKMEIISVTAPHNVVIKLDFMKPFEAHNTAHFTLVPDGSGTLVTWTMSGANTLPSKIMHAFVDMEHMVGKDFARGLGMIKLIVEKSA